MTVRTALYVFLLILLAVFVLANWSVLATPTKLNLLIATISAPAGVVGLVVAAAVLAIDWSAHSMHRLAWSRERRSLRQEVARLRAQADQAEASRLSALQEIVERETARIRVQLDKLLEQQQAGVPVPGHDA